MYFCYTRNTTHFVGFFEYKDPFVKLGSTSGYLKQEDTTESNLLNVMKALQFLFRKKSS